MITIDGVQYRNLEEQVKKNKDDIQYILEEEGVLNEFGIQVVGEVDSSSDLPDPTTYEGEFGDAYAVGTTTPYELYIYTRANGEHPTNYWFNIGEFPLPGPAGPTGPAGEDGETGLPALQDKGHRTTSTVPIIGMALGTAASNFNRTPVVGDTFFQLVLGLDGTSAEGRTWITNNEITSVGSLSNYRVSSVLETTGAQGPQGNQGVPGNPGQQGPQGPIGPQGNPGQSFVIAGTVSNEGQLPDPSTLADNIAYLVGTSAPYDLYVQLQDSSEWFNAGIVEGVQGPQGPQGIQGPQGEQGPQGIPGPQGEPGPMPTLANTRGTSDSIAISQQGIENIFYGNKISLGINSQVPMIYGVAIGADTNCTLNSIAIGAGANSQGDIAIGSGSSSASGSTSIGIGSNSSSFSVAIGRDSYAASGVAIGYESESAGGVAIGANANCGFGVAIGANVCAPNGYVIGKDIQSDGLIPSSLIAFGNDIQTNSSGLSPTISIGKDINNKTDDICIGGGLNSLGGSILIGRGISANSTDSIIIGSSSGTESFYSIVVGGFANVGTDSIGSIAIGRNSEVNGDYSIAVGYNSQAAGSNSIAIGQNAIVNNTVKNSIQLGKGNNITANTFQVGDYPLLNLTTGLIPSERIQGGGGGGGTTIGTSLSQYTDISQSYSSFLYPSGFIGSHSKFIVSIVIDTSTSTSDYHIFGQSIMYLNDQNSNKGFLLGINSSGNIMKACDVQGYIDSTGFIWLTFSNWDSNIPVNSVNYICITATPISES